MGSYLKQIEQSDEESENSFMDYEQFLGLLKYLNMINVGRMTPTEKNLVKDLWNIEFKAGDNQ